MPSSPLNLLRKRNSVTPITEANIKRKEFKHMYCGECGCTNNEKIIFSFNLANTATQANQKLVNCGNAQRS